MKKTNPKPLPEIRLPTIELSENAEVTEEEYQEEESMDSYHRYMNGIVRNSVAEEFGASDTIDEFDNHSKNGIK